MSDMFRSLWEKIKSLFGFGRSRIDVVHSGYPSEDTGKEIDRQLQGQLWAVGGGKGGVGKSLVALMLGATLTRWGKKVVIVDADLGGSNLHILTGNNNPPCTLGDFMQKRIKNIEDIALETPVRDLRVICGADDIIGMANPQNARKARLFNCLKDLEADVILLDLGAGTSYTVLDFFLFAPNRIILLSPQTTAIQNAYGFVKSCLHRKLTLEFKNDPDSMALINQAVYAQDSKIKTIDELVEKSSILGPEVQSRLSECVGQMTTGLVVNMVREQMDVQLGRSMIGVANKYLSLDPEYLGFIEYDKTLDKSVNRMAEFLNEGSDIITKIGFYDLANKIVKKLYKESKGLPHAGRKSAHTGTPAGVS
jgi:flagellar biosynthesis protein FlhG